MPSVKAKSEALQCIDREWGGCSNAVQGERAIGVCDQADDRVPSNNGEPDESGDDQDTPMDPPGRESGDRGNPVSSTSTGGNNADVGETVFVAPPSNPAGDALDSLTVLIAGVVGGLLCVGLCVAAAVALFCFMTKRRSSTVDLHAVPSLSMDRYRVPADGNGYGQEFSREAKTRNELAKGNVVRTAPDTKPYVSGLSKEGEQANRDPARYMDGVQ